MLYASLVFDREPLDWAQFPQLLNLWLQNVGGITATAIFIVVLARYLQPRSILKDVWKLPTSLQFINAVLPFVLLAMALCYAFVIACWLGDGLGVAAARRLLPRTNTSVPLTVGDWLLSVNGTIAVCIACTPISIDLLTRISPGRILAIASLSWKEAIRGRILWIFAVIPVIFLFAEWFVPENVKDTVKINVMISYSAMGILFGFAAGLLGSFSIPNDVKNNSIHTIVTKPVEKFEIVLGRFFGYASLLTVGLFVVASLSLIYVIRGVTEEARAESYKARVVAYGNLSFAGTKNANPQKADSVGREWGYRDYITGPKRGQRDAFRQYAIWDFASLPSNLATRTQPVRFEYEFDIFRLSKGEEGKGVFVTFTFTDGFRESDGLENLVDVVNQDRTQLEAKAEKEREQAVANEATRQGAEAAYQAARAGIELELLKKHGIFQVKGQHVADYHTLDFEVDPSVFAVLLKRHADLQARNPDRSAPPLRVLLSVDLSTEQQMLGVARQDFYLLASEQPFWLNFLKGVGGIWCSCMLLLGVAAACSTYLNGVISMLTTFFVYGAGMFGAYLREVANKELDGGGPAQSFVRVVRHMPVAGKLDENSPSTRVIEGVDAVFSWWIGRIINLFPDVNRHDLHTYVASGFDVGLINVLFLDNVLPVAGYLLPWAILAYFLMKFREIANPS